MNNLRNCLSAMSLSVLLAALTFPAAAKSPIDDKSVLVCALSEVVGCISGTDCMHGQASEFELPALAILDSMKRELRSSYVSGEENISKITSIALEEERVSFQGNDNGVNWDLTVNRSNGRMRASGVSESLSFLVFGSCTTY